MVGASVRRMLGATLVVTLMGCSATRAAVQDAPAGVESAEQADELTALATFLTGRNLRGVVARDRAEAERLGARASAIWLEQGEPERVVAIALDPAMGLFNIQPLRPEPPLARAARVFAATGGIVLQGSAACGLLATGSLQLQYSYVLRDESPGYPLDTFQTVRCRIDVREARRYLAQEISAEELLRRSGADVVAQRS